MKLGPQVLQEVTIYVVDDDEAVRDSLRILLELAKMTTKVYASGEEFLENTDFSHPGCVLLDINMPGLNGLEVLNLLAVRRLMYPVVIVTGNADSKTKAQALNAGALAVLEKPLQEQLLLETIQHALEQDHQSPLDET